MTQIEDALRRIRHELDVPPAPDLGSAVLARLEAPRTSRVRPRWAVAFAFVVLAALAATLAIPDARSALLRVLHIGGERIERVDELPTVSVDPAGLDLELVLGARVTLEQARQEAAFDLRELDTEPDRVYIGRRGTVWFLYGTPRDVRLLLAQTPRTRVDEQLLVTKLVPSGTRVEPVVVDGSPAYFLSGEPHAVLLLDEDGAPIEDAAWLAQDVLVWERDGVAIRLEGVLTEREAVELASSLR